MISWDSWSRFERDTAPYLLVFFFTIMTQVLAVFGTIRDDVTWSLLGNAFSWIVVICMLGWAFSSLKFFGDDYKGPPSPAGVIPVYKSNGFQYFGATFGLYFLLLVIRPQTAVEISINFPQIIATCNLFAFALCLHLFTNGKSSAGCGNGSETESVMLAFYRGVETHPRIFDVDVKQLINCRFGLMSWLLLDVTFFVSCCVETGLSVPLLVCILLQTIYLAKFYWWETGYFDTLDMTLDNAGYYICWGCMVLVPSFYTFSAYFLSSREPLVNDNVAWLIFFFGIIVTGLNYWVDWEKQYFRQYAGKCRIWGKVATFIPASYKTPNGPIKKSQLLTSGFWGIARHLNYVFEILVAWSWSLPCYGYGICPFMYPIFLTILLVHRTFRDERKCAQKYGQAWEEYCKKVPYRMIPGLF